MSFCIELKIKLISENLSGFDFGKPSDCFVHKWLADWIKTTATEAKYTLAIAKQELHAVRFAIIVWVCVFRMKAKLYIYRTFLKYNVSSKNRVLVEKTSFSYSR